MRIALIYIIFSFLAISSRAQSYYDPAEESNVNWEEPKLGQFIRIPQYNLLFFKLDSAVLVGGFRFLDSLAERMKNHPEIILELSVHSDCRASKEFNADLTQQRADNIKNYLIAQGVKPEHLVAKGYGESKLLNKCACEPNNKGEGANCTEYEHLKNRRLELKIISIKKK